MNIETHVCCEARRKKNPTGRRGDPLPATNSDEFDRLQDLGRGGGIMVLEDGDYWTGGAWALRKIGQVQMHGNGSSRCNLALRPESPVLPTASYSVGGTQTVLRRPDTSIVSFPVAAKRHEISGIKLSAKRAIDFDGRLIVSGGINAESPAWIHDVEIEGIRGSWTIRETGLAHEAFGVRVVGPGGGTHVSDVAVYLEPNSYGNGCTIGHLEPDATPSLVERVSIYGDRLNHCGFTGSRNVAFRQFSASGVLHGIFQDTAPMSGCTFRDGVIRTHWCGARFHSHNAQETRTYIEIDGVTMFFDLIPASGNGIVLAMTHTGQEAEMKGIRCNAYVPSPPANFYELSTDVSKARLAYESRVDGPRKGQINEPPPIKSKATGFRCVADLEQCSKYRVRNP